MSQQYSWPSSSDVTLEGSTNGLPIPNNSIVVAGENASGNVEPLQLTNAGALIVTPIAGSTTDVNLTKVGGAAITEGQKTSAASLPVVIASDQSTLPISASSLPLPAGASTATLQSTGNTSLSSILANQTNGTQTTLVSNFPATQPVSGTVAVSSLPSIPTGSNAIGSVNVSNFPATQPVSGTVAVSNFPASQAVTGTFFQATQPVSIAASVAVTGAFFQATQPVSGTVSLGAGSAAIGTVKSQASTPTALTVTQAAVTVGTSAVRATVSGSAPASTRIALIVTPDQASTATFYIGSATVTNSGATRGAEIVAGQAFIANNDAGDYYIVSSTAGQTVTILEQA